MDKLKIITGVMATLVSALVSISSYATWEKDKTYNITILHTNDHHGRFWHNTNGEYGLAAQKTVIDQIRQEVKAKGGSLLLLSGGDINTGVPESDMLNAEPDFLGMSKIGYDAMALGNHEFDNPLTILRQQQKWASFPLLSANLYEKKTNKRPFDPYAIFDKQGIKIAVIGLTTEDTMIIANPKNFEGFEFRDPKIEAQKVIDKLKQTEKPDIIIAATHMGHYDNDQHGSNAPGDVALARFVKRGDLDMIVGGHSQNPVCMESINQRQKNYIPGTPCIPDQQNGTWIVQAHEWGKYVGRADFTFRNGQFTLVGYQLIPVNLKKAEKQADGKTTYSYYTSEIARDNEMLELLTPYQKKGEEKLNIIIGSTQIYLEGERDKVRYEQTNLGKLIIKASMARTNSDFGVMGGGGVRASLNAGDLTYRDILTVQPFGNIVSYAEMKGQALIDYITVVANRKKGSGGYPQWANITFTHHQDGSVTDIIIGGKPLDMNKTYRFCLPDYHADGGDGYPILTNYINTGFVDAEMLKEFIEKNSPITEETVK